MATLTVFWDVCVLQACGCAMELCLSRVCGISLCTFDIDLRVCFGVGCRVVSGLILRLVICARYDIFLIAAFLPLKSLILSWG